MPDGVVDGAIVVEGIGGAVVPESAADGAVVRAGAPELEVVAAWDGSGVVSEADAGTESRWDGTSAVTGVEASSPSPSIMGELVGPSGVAPGFVESPVGLPLCVADGALEVKATALLAAPASPEAVGSMKEANFRSGSLQLEPTPSATQQNPNRMPRATLVFRRMSRLACQELEVPSTKSAPSSILRLEGSGTPARFDEALTYLAHQSAGCDEGRLRLLNYEAGYPSPGGFFSESSGDTYSVSRAQ